jgi:hypothetical protein
MDLSFLILSPARTLKDDGWCAKYSYHGITTAQRRDVAVTWYRVSHLKLSTALIAPVKVTRHYRYPLGIRRESRILCTQVS